MTVLFLFSIYICSFGRKKLVIAGLVLNSLLGLIQSFSTSYIMYIIFEFLSAAIAAGVYPATFILSIEWANTKHRVTVGQLVLLSYNLGIAFSGVLALYAREFRLYLRLIYTCGLITAIIMLFSCESLRWLLVNGKQKQIEKILVRASKVNRQELSPKTLEIVRRRCEKTTATEHSGIAEQNDTAKQALKSVFKSQTLLIRLAISSYSWVVGTFVVYGVSIISVTIHEDKYMSFILVALAGVPSGLLAVVFLEYLGRPRTLSLSFFIAGSSIVVAKLLPSGYTGVAVLCFMSGKLFGTIALNACYVQTSEIWSTDMRHTMLSISSSIGRLGSILAPLTPMLVSVLVLTKARSTIHVSFLRRKSPRLSLFGHSAFYPSYAAC